MRLEYLAANVSSIIEQLEEASENRVSGITTSTFAVTAKRSEIERLIWVYCSPPIFFLGIVGNVLTVLVTSQRPTRNTSSGIYLLVMSLAAIGVYLSGFLSEWLRASEFINLIELGPWSCRVNKFIYYSSGDVAIWTLTLLTVDRVVAVCFPLRKVDLCTRRRAITLSCIVATLAVLKNLHTFWTRGSEYDSNGKVLSHCGAAQSYRHFEKYVRPWIVFTVVTMLPVTIILVGNILIIRELARGRLIQRDLRASGSKKPRTRMTTTMCLAASFSFIFFSSPSIILIVLKPYYPGPSYDIAKAVNNLLVHVNYAANFFLYCFSGRNFRLRLRLLMLRICCQSKRSRYEVNSECHSKRIRASAELLGGGSSRTTRSNSFTQGTVNV